MSYTNFIYQDFIRYELNTTANQFRTILEEKILKDITSFFFVYLDPRTLWELTVCALIVDRTVHEHPEVALQEVVLVGDHAGKVKLSTVGAGMVKSQT